MNIKLVIFAFACALISWSQVSFAQRADCPERVGGYGNCSGDHCGAVEKNVAMNKWCIGAKLAGCPILVLENNSHCFCNCSCMSGDALILMADGTEKHLADVREGDLIFSPLAKSRVSSVKRKTRSDATGFSAYILQVNGQTNVTVSPNHVFLTQGGRYVRASQLNEGDLLLNHDISLDTISEIELVSSFKGKLFNLIINEESVDHSDHFYVANGIISGDFIVQTELDGGNLQENAKRVKMHPDSPSRKSNMDSFPNCSAKQRTEILEHANNLGWCQAGFSGPFPVVLDGEFCLFGCE